MIRVKKSIQAEEVRLKSKHVLFVEGKDNDAVDPEVLRELLGNRLRIEALGASFSVKSVAEALYPHHPSYYFLIDRDHQDDAFINKCWANFPDPETRNLLVWKRREIENYFLEPDYLFSSQYCKLSKAELKKRFSNFLKTDFFLMLPIMSS